MQACPQAVQTSPKSGESNPTNTPEGDKTGEAVHNTPESSPVSAPSTRKYGPWMLVTRKTSATDWRNGNSNGPHKAVPKISKGNPFDVLQHADGEEDDENTLHAGQDNLTQTRRGKGKTMITETPSNNNSRVNPQAPKPPRKQSNDRGKSSSAPVPPTANLPREGLHAPARVGNRNTRPVGDPEASSSTNNILPRGNQQVRNRGGRQTHTRGTSRGGGRGGRNPVWSCNLGPDYANQH
nr:hypothetical protein Iba_chr05dCG18920 [Ipomoea batatas]